MLNHGFRRSLAPVASCPCLMPARRGSQNTIPEIEKLTGSRENSRGKQNQATKNDKNLAMATLLYINVSPRGDYSISRQLRNAVVQAWKKKNPTGRIIERDLSKTPLTFVDLDWIVGAFSPPEH